jgi:hypothetical protein
MIVVLELTQEIVENCDLPVLAAMTITSKYARDIAERHLQHRIKVLLEFLLNNKCEAAGLF